MRLPFANYIKAHHISGAAVCVGGLVAAMVFFVVGAGIRLQAKHHLLFETIVNLVHREAPAAAIGFNTTPLDTADAVLRFIEGDRS